MKVVQTFKFSVTIDLLLKHYGINIRYTIQFIKGKNTLRIHPLYRPVFKSISQFGLNVISFNLFSNTFFIYYEIILYPHDSPYLPTVYPIPSDRLTILYSSSLYFYSSYKYVSHSPDSCFLFLQFFHQQPLANFLLPSDILSFLFPIQS